MMHERRACIVDGATGWCLGIFQIAYVHTAVMVGDISGQIAHPMALIETPTGAIKYVEPYEVVFQSKEAGKDEKRVARYLQPDR